MGPAKRVAEGEGLWGAASDPSVWSEEGNSQRQKARRLELLKSAGMLCGAGVAANHCLVMEWMLEKMLFPSSV